MKARVYRGPGQKELEERAIPVIQAPNDAIVRVSSTTMCGTGRAPFQAARPAASWDTKGWAWPRKPGPA